jgi:hypothetical protein
LARFSHALATCEFKPRKTALAVPIPHQEQSSNAIRVLVRCDTEPKVRVSELATRSSPRESSNALPHHSLFAFIRSPPSSSEQSRLPSLLLYYLTPRQRTAFGNELLADGSVLFIF